MQTEAEGSILMEAQALVYGDREESYSHPYDDFGRTAAMATAFGFARLLKPCACGAARPIERMDIGFFQILVKLSRLAHRFKHDSIVDVAGYAETIHRVERRAQELGPR